MGLIIILLSLLTFVYILIFIIHKIGVKYPQLQKRVFWLLPKGIIIVAIIYMFKSYYELFIFIDTQEVPAKVFTKVLQHNDTYSAIVNFFALLTFYQLLEDRHEKVYAKPFKKLSELEVIPKDVHNQILKKECDRVAKEYKIKIKEIKRANAK